MRANNADAVGFIHDQPALRFIERNGVLSSLEKAGFATEIRRHDAFKFLEHGGGVALTLVFLKRSHLTNLKGGSLNFVTSKGAKSGCCRSTWPLVVESRAIGILREHMGSPDGNHLLILVHPCMNGLVVVGKTFAPRGHAQRLAQHRVSCNEIRLRWFSKLSVQHGLSLKVQTRPRPKRP
jgi:hypothetical protein